MVLISRRGLLVASAGALASWTRAFGFGSKDFWNSKDPSQWDSEEIKRLVTKSPWAREIAGERVTTKKKSGTAFPRTTPTGRRPRNPVPDPAGADGTVRVQTSYKGIAVWESAKPVRTAFEEPLPAEFAEMYVISVSGVPMGTSRSALERARQVTTLRLKGHEPLEAAVAKQWEHNRTVFLFGFAKQAMPITKDNKEVGFHTTVSRAELNAKFSPREMVYRGELAL
jgi:hypothetical protein